MSLTPVGKLTLNVVLIAVLGVIFVGSLFGAVYGIVTKETLASLIDKLVVGAFALLSLQSSSRGQQR
jgi:hypothetical protein